MFYKYSPNGEILYVPVLQNWLSFSGTYNMQNNFLNNDFVNLLADKIETEESIILLDFHGVFSANSRSFERLNKAESKRIIFYNIDDNLYGILKTDCKDLSFKDDEKLLLASATGYLYYKENITKILEIPFAIIRKIVKESYLWDDKEYYPIDSSGVLGNKYIDIKRMFYSPSHYYLVLIKMAGTIITRFPDFDKLICSSFNGAIISTILGQLLNKEVLYIMKLGPNLSFRDKELIYRIEKGKKYLYIGDVVCIGTEVKMAKTLVKLNNSEIIGGVVVVRYLDPVSLDNNILSLIEINDDDDFDYRIFVKKV